MSAETSAPKTSFLTRLFETASPAAQDGTVTDEQNPGFLADRKKFAKIAVTATVVTATVIAVSWKSLSKFAPVEEEVAEETITD